MRNVIRPGLGNLCQRIAQIRAAVGTPFYAYDWRTFEAAVRRLISSTEASGLENRCRFYLAMFALPNTSLLRRLLELDRRLGLSCNSPEEILALELSGFTEWDRVVFSGGVLPRADLAAIASNGCMVHAASPGNIESLAEIAAAQRIGLRLDLSSNGLKGIRLPDLPHCLSVLERSGKGVSAIHAYGGTQVSGPETLVEHARRLLSVAQQIDDISEVNFGGGFRYDYDAWESPTTPGPELDAYCKSVASLVGGIEKGHSLTLAWEPGRVAFAGGGFYITEVIETRRGGANEMDLYIDGSFTQIPAPRMVGRQHRVLLLDRQGALRAGSLHDTRLCGATTLSTDQLLPAPCLLPAAIPGDLVVILDVGAYGRAGAYNFLGRCMPPEILLDTAGWEIIRIRQAPHHLLAGCISYEYASSDS